MTAGEITGDSLALYALLFPIIDERIQVALRKPFDADFAKSFLQRLVDKQRAPLKGSPTLYVIEVVIDIMSDS
ncbi:hypothetical protein V5O39_03590 [Pseudomonas parakoreensis]